MFFLLEFEVLSWNQKDHGKRDLYDSHIYACDSGTSFPIRLELSEMLTCASTSQDSHEHVLFS